MRMKIDWGIVFGLAGYIILVKDVPLWHLCAALIIHHHDCTRLMLAHIQCTGGKLAKLCIV